MAYTTIKKPSDYFNTKLYSGSASSQSITGVGFQPDLIIVKNRTTTGNHYTNDIIRGASQKISTNSASAEFTQDGISSFDSDGFTVGTASTDTNNSGNNYVSWNWKANGAGSSNTDGSITSTVSANTTSGFSIVTYTGNGTDGATVGHGLTSPKLILIKSRGAATPWIMYGYPNHPSFSTDGSLLQLESTSAMADSSTKEASIGASTVTFVDAGGDINASGVDFVMYCFQEKQGFSKFGSYVGNGSTDGTFVYTGFKPAFILYKNISTVENWEIHDTKRNPSNLSNKIFYANQSIAEATTDRIDILSNGFKSRTTNSACNSSGNTYIYMAFAEEPLVGDNPATAR